MSNLKDEEKSVSGLSPALPTYSQSTGTVLPDNGIRGTKEDYEGAIREEDWGTRNGLTLRSFGKRYYGKGIVELNRSMHPRHLHMIAIGGSIGAGFFVGSGSALSNGGPASLFIDFMIIGVMMFNVVYALGELSVMYPVSGGFYTFSTRFIDPSWGFAMGWNYVMQWAVVLPLELTVCGVTISYWNDTVSVGKSRSDCADYHPCEQANRNL
jgi:amino acid transporter